MEWHLAELKMLQALRAAWACPFLDKSLAFVTRLGDHGLAFILLALVLLCIPKTRKLGLGVGIALILDFLLVNLGLKPLAGRTRPYDLGVPLEILVRKPGDFSFPSGHTAAAMAAAVTLIPAGKRVFASCHTSVMPRLKRSIFLSICSLFLVRSWRLNAKI